MKTPKSVLLRRKKDKRESYLRQLPMSELLIIARKRGRTYISKPSYLSVIEDILWEEGLTEYTIEKLEKLEREEI